MSEGLPTINNNVQLPEHSELSPNTVDKKKATTVQAVLAIVSGVLAFTEELSITKTAVIITGMVTAAAIEYALCRR